MNKYFSEFRYWFRSRFIKSSKHHVVYTDLKPGYHDPSEVLLYACFKVLENQIEEMGGEDEVFRYNKILEMEKSEYDFLQKQKEILDIWLWWKYKRPLEIIRLDKACKNRKKFQKIDEEIQKETENMLIRLVKIRDFLWT